jgi:hypothetical protein
MNRAASQWLDREYVMDVRILRRAFATVDTRDPTDLQRWFADRPYPGADHARIAGVSLKTVRRWKDAAGLPRGKQRPPGWRRQPKAALAAPPDWSSGSWLADQYAAGHSIRDLARAIQRSYTATRRRLRRSGTYLRSVREATGSRHPCCNRTWLLLHYVTEFLSITRCARLAGVSTCTMAGWLIRHEIRIRSSGEQ